MNFQLWPSYELSKTLAEDCAWKFARENNIDMVVINPGVVLGPLLQPSLNQTSAFILTLLDGNFSRYLQCSCCTEIVFDFSASWLQDLLTEMLSSYSQLNGKLMTYSFE